MQTKERTRKGSIAAAAVAAALLVLAGLPARADHLPPGTTAFVGAWAEDGFIDAGEATAPESERPVDWQEPGDALSAQARFTDINGVLIPEDNGMCFLDPVNLNGHAPGGEPTTGLNGACMAAAVAQLENRQILFQVRWSDDGTEFGDWVSSQPLTVDTQVGVPTITRPLDGSILSRESLGTGTADPHELVELIESTTDAKLVETRADGDGNWSVPLRLESGHYSMQARVTDGAGNVALSDIVEFDVDGDAPDARISSPPHLGVFDADDPIIVEGVAADLNDQEYGGVVAVEVNIHNMLTGHECLSTPSDHACNLLVVQFGEIVHQENASCDGCPATGINEVSWIYDASWLGPGVWTFQVRTFDRVGNSALQPQQVTITRLPVTIG